MGRSPDYLHSPGEPVDDSLEFPRMFGAAIFFALGMWLTEIATQNLFVFTFHWVGPANPSKQFGYIVANVCTEAGYSLGAWMCYFLGEIVSHLTLWGRMRRSWMWGCCVLGISFCIFRWGLYGLLMYLHVDWNDKRDLFATLAMSFFMGLASLRAMARKPLDERDHLDGDSSAFF